MTRYPMRAVLLFARSPEAEARAKHLRPEAAAIFRGILRSWRTVAATTNAPLLIARTQRGRTFGQRLANSVRAAFESGASSLVIAGIDSPPPDAATLQECFENLETGRVRAVLGPASDGGLYLIGLSSMETPLLASIRPRQSDLLQVCSRYFSHRVVILPPASDLDCPSDLHRLAAEPRWSPYLALVPSSFPKIFSDEPSLFAAVHQDEPWSSRAPPRLTLS